MISSVVLFQYPKNRADINVSNKDGLTGAHILLARLMDLSVLESKSAEARPQSLETDEELEEAIENTMECLRILLELPVLR